jgi:hypothetical protein
MWRNPFKWKKTTSDDVLAKAAAAQPVSVAELAKINQLAEQALDLYRNTMPEFDYDSQSVKFMSDSINEQRLQLINNREASVTASNLLGAFFGKAAMQCNQGVKSEWIKSGKEIGIAFIHGTMEYHIYPINRVMHQIQAGEERSSYQMFVSVDEWVKSCAAKQFQQ